MNWKLTIIMKVLMTNVTREKLTKKPKNKGNTSSTNSVSSCEREFKNKNESKFDRCSKGEVDKTRRPTVNIANLLMKDYSLMYLKCLYLNVYPLMTIQE